MLLHSIAIAKIHWRIFSSETQFLPLLPSKVQVGTKRGLLSTPAWTLTPQQGSNNERQRIKECRIPQCFPDRGAGHINRSVTMTSEDPEVLYYPESATKPMNQGVCPLPAAHPVATLHRSRGREKKSGRWKETEYLPRVLHWTKFTKMDYNLIPILGSSGEKLGGMSFRLIKKKFEVTFFSISWCFYKTAMSLGGMNK